ncbi:MAG: cation transporter [Bacteroidetes bacterium]|nr:cation transporter [Bacteroidota bacterium]MBU1720250.1 cation transporter [Bacteroidota bacterium]
MDNRISFGHFKLAIGLAWFTIVYNIAEGLISVWFGLEDETLTLFGFGADSFIETISAFGILYMVIRTGSNPQKESSLFERSALMITGVCFFVLSAILVAGAIFNIIQQNKPESTLPGVIISTVSIVVMIFLIRSKKSLGRKLNSSAMIADANCNLVCVYMSITLLLSSALFELTGIPWLDVAGALGIVYFSIREGLEAIQKARTGKLCGCESGNCH